MDTEEFTPSSGWISTKALRDTADLKKSVQKVAHRKCASVLPESFSASSASICNPPKASTPKGCHQRFNTTSLELSQPAKPNDHDSIGEKRYLHQLAKLNQEIVILSGELKHANELISQLSEKLAEQNTKHAHHLQALQERHEQKTKKGQQEVEFLISSFERYKAAELDKMAQEYRRSLEEMENRFEAKEKDREMYFAEEMNKKDCDHKQHLRMLKHHFIEMISNLKSKFVEELEEVETKYKGKIQGIRNYQRKSTVSCEADEESSTMPEIESEKAKIKTMPDNIYEDVSNYFKEKIISDEHHLKFEHSVMKLLNQLK
jgi:hypothetical protein